MKEVPKGGDTFKGVFLPGGTRVAHSTWAVTRNQEVFGEDAEMFRPERWLEQEQADPEKRAQMARAAELVFGYGRWQCSGKTIALIELNKIFVQVRFSSSLFLCSALGFACNGQLTTPDVMFPDLEELRLGISQPRQAMGRCQSQCVASERNVGESVGEDIKAMAGWVNWILDRKVSIEDT